MPDEPTLGEIGRRLDRLETRVDSRVVSLTTYHAERQHDRDEVTALRNDVARVRADHVAEITELRAEIRAVSERMAQTFRLAVTGVLSPIVVGVVLWLITRTQ